MTINSAKTFLNKIKLGQPINYPRFIRWISQLNLPYEVESKDIKSTKLKGNYYLVEVLSSRLLEDLETFGSLDNTSRVSLATQNKSHSKKVAGSMIVCRKGSEHPQVVIVDENNKYLLPFPLNDFFEADSCLVIENQQNFLSIKETLTVLDKDTQYNFGEGICCIFASGNAITNTLHQRFLSQFSQILLFLDLDLGGLEIAASLNKMLPNQNLVFLISNKTRQILENVVSVKPPDYLKDIESIRQKHPFLNEAASLILETRKVIEQEAYLNG